MSAGEKRVKQFNRNALVSAGKLSHYWQTPLDVIEASRQALGGKISLDPASDVAANLDVRADFFFNSSALEGDWSLDPSDTVFLNPPGGTLKGKSLPVLYWKTLLEEMREGGSNLLLCNGLVKAVFIAFSAGSFFQTVQSLGPNYSPHVYPICWPTKRLQYRITYGHAVQCAPRAGSGLDRTLRKHEASCVERGTFPHDYDILIPPAPPMASAIIAPGVRPNDFAEAFSAIGECVP